MAKFITLTYDTNNVPITPKGYMALNKRDLQLFFKRLRKAQQSQTKNDSVGNKNGYRLSGKSIKYFAVGEYGGRTNRPHYHIILFNAKLELIDPAWNLGAVHYGEVTGASIGYCLKYMMKPGKIPMHQNDDRIREFALMSKGLGDNYITQQMVSWHKATNDRMYINLEGGKKASMPRYYKNKIYDKAERSIIAEIHKEKLEEEAIRRAALGNLQTAREREQSVQAAFRRMYKNSEKGRNKA